MNRFNCALAALLLSFPSYSYAKGDAAKSLILMRQNHDHQNLIKKVRGKVRPLEAPILRFIPSPGVSPQAGQEFSVFIEAQGYQNSNILLMASLDGQPVELFRSSEKLWIFQAGAFSEIKSHALSVEVAIEDKAIAGEIRQAIDKISSEIDSLAREIDREQDPMKRATLTAKRNEKTAIRNQLNQELMALRRVLAAQEFRFEVVASQGGADFPRITSVTPDVGPVGGGTEIAIVGENFSAGAQVKVGGIAATSVSVANATTITAILPAFPTEGPKNLELILPPLPGKTEVRNAFFANAFFAAASSTDPQLNAKPVAVAPGVQTASVGDTVTLNGSGSYDTNSNPFSYKWVFRAVPEGSAFTVGSELAQVQSPNFQPDVPGYYSVELKTKETDTAELLESAPAMTAVLANGTENSAPMPAVAAIITSKNQNATATIVPNDPDAGNTHTYSVQTQPTSGTLVLSGGQVTYTPNTSFVGEDSFVIRVTDSGAPALYGDVVVPVSVKAAKITIAGLSYNIRAKDGLIRVDMSADSLATSFGSVVAGIWSFGDGTSERAVDLSAAEGGFITHDYHATGSYPVSFTVQDSNGLIETFNQVVNLTSADVPVLRVSANVISGSLPLTVNLDASASTDAEGITRFRWRWGDAGSFQEDTGAVATNSHTYTTAGTYRVRVRANDAARGLVDGFVDIYAGVTPPAGGSRPIANIAVAARELVLGGNHSFSGSGSFDPNPAGSVSSFNWKFGDYITCNFQHPTPGCVGSGVNPTFTYGGVGNYWAELIAVGAQGRSSQTVSKEVYVVNQGRAPRAVINKPNNNGFAGVAPYQVEVDAYSSFDYDGTITNYKWKFCDPFLGENCESINSTAVHTYTVPNFYYLELQVTDNDGNKHTTSAGVSVTSAAFAKNNQKRAKNFESDPAREELRQQLLKSCFVGQVGEACYDLGKMYEEDGDDFAKQKLFEKACSLGHEAACSK